MQGRKGLAFLTRSVDVFQPFVSLDFWRSLIASFCCCCCCCCCCCWGVQSIVKLKTKVWSLGGHDRVQKR